MVHPPRIVAKILFFCRLRISCSYSASSSALPVNVQVFTLPPPLPETQPGHLTLELQIAKGKTLFCGVSGLWSKSCHFSGRQDPTLVTRYLPEVFMWVMVYLKAPRGSNLFTASTCFGLLQTNTIAPTTLLVTTQW